MNIIEAYRRTDEPALGAGVFVTARVGAGGRLRWGRTEISRPT